MPASSNNMQAEDSTTGIEIGKYSIDWIGDSLWITTDDGEGGEFNEEDFEAAIDKFYKDNF
jgi:hypothetical protein